MIIESWIKEISHPSLREKILELRQRYEFLSIHQYSDYQPTRGDSQKDYREFMSRMEKWLEQFDTVEEKLTAFKSIEYLFFAGIAEYDELYRCAYQTIERWLMKVNDLDPFVSTSKIQDKIRKECWICPITDSLLINSFLHITGISGQRYRPDWFSLEHFAEKKAIKTYIAKTRLNYLVLLEDFVGSGNQAYNVVKFAADATDKPILVVPLVVCAPGEEKLRQLCDEYKSVSVQSIVTLPNNCLVTSAESTGEPQTFEKLREVMQKHYERLDCCLVGRQYGFNEVGSMVVTYSNCPNNTPPLYHRARPGETPLFPRLSRPWSRNE